MSNSIVPTAPNQSPKVATQKLSSLSPKDKTWDVLKRETVKVSEIYSKSDEFQRYAERTNDCANFLSFNKSVDPETGELNFKIKSADACHCRNCPICQWRRSLMYKARFLEALQGIETAFPKHRWIFLTLTIENPPVSDLRASLGEMRKAWHKLIKRKEFEAVKGFIRSTEVTMPKGNPHYSHPHFHALLFVPPSWFGKSYVKQQRWEELWQECLRVDYPPIVDVRAVTAKRSFLNEDGKKEKGLGGAVAELLKYSVKSKDMTTSPEWFFELTRQTHGLKFISSGGVLKNVLKESQKETDADLLLLNENGSGDDGSRLGFKWDMKKYYRRNPKADRAPQKE